MTVQLLFTVFVFQHVIGYGGGHFLRPLILTKVFHKVPIRSNQVHDDAVVNLESWGMGMLGMGMGNGKWNLKLTK